MRFVDTVFPVGGSHFPEDDWQRRGHILDTSDRTIGPNQKYMKIYVNANYTVFKLFEALVRGFDYPLLDRPIITPLYCIIFLFIL